MKTPFVLAVILTMLAVHPGRAVIDTENAVVMMSPQNLRDKLRRSGSEYLRITEAVWRARRLELVEVLIEELPGTGILARIDEEKDIDFKNGLILVVLRAGPDFWLEKPEYRDMSRQVVKMHRALVLKKFINGQLAEGNFTEGWCETRAGRYRIASKFQRVLAARKNRP